MAIPQLADNMPSYFIYRDVQPGEPFDPTASLLFVPPKGSDDLFDALRIAFPHLKTHSERMRQAVIQFLVEEREAEQSLQTSPAMTIDSTWPSLPTTACAPSVLSSPETNNLSTPASFAPSPQTFATQLTRQASIATNASQSTSPPAIDRMTSVFSLSTSSQPKQRVRRKMTEAEKVEYRKRRIVKACDKCAKRKRKCPHNQAEMETITSPTGKSNSKVSKSTSSKSSKSPSSTTQQQAAFDPSIFSAEDANFDDDSFNFGDFAPTEDFALFQDFQDPFAELSMDSFLSYDHFDPTNNYQPGDFFTPDLSPTQREWQHGNVQPVAVSDQMFSDKQFPGQMAWDSEYDSSPGQSSSSESLGHHVSLQPDQMNQINVPPIDSMFSSMESLSSAVDLEQPFGDMENWQEVGSSRSHFEGASQPGLGGEELTFGKMKKRRVENSGGNGNELLWEHLRTGQPEKPVPTHTLHVHDADSQQLTGLDKSTNIPQGAATIPWSQQTAPGLASTVEVVQTSTGPRTRRDPATSTAATERVPGVLLQHAQRVPQETQPEEDLQHSRPSRSTSLSDNNRRASGISTSQERGSQSDLRLSRPIWDQKLISSSNEQELASPSVSVPSGLRRSAVQQGRPFSSVDERTVAKQATQQTVLDQSTRNQASSRQQGAYREDLTLGQGLPETADPSSQLYMARKRVLTGLAVNTILQTRTTGSEELRVPLGSLIRQQNPVQANGGAYPRLGEAETSPSTSLAAMPVHTQNRNPTAADFSGDTDQWHGTDVVGAAGQVPGESVRPRGNHGRLDVQEDRLRDTHKFKDHHGRSAGLSSYLLAMFGCALLLQAASLLSNTITSTALLLALVVPYREASQSSPLDKIVHCTTKNSRWLSSAFASLTETKYGLADPCFEKPGWVFPGTDRTWLKGSMHPHAFATPRSSAARC